MGAILQEGAVHELQPQCRFVAVGRSYVRVTFDVWALYCSAGLQLLVDLRKTTEFCRDTSGSKADEDRKGDKNGNTRKTNPQMQRGETGSESETTNKGCTVSNSDAGQS